jgi:phospholipase/carboxylesterase
MTNKMTSIIATGDSRLGIVFLHGSGDTGEGFCEWLEETWESDSFLSNLEKLNISYRFPSASAKPYTLAGGSLSNVWHDRRELALTCSEDMPGINNSIEVIDENIDYLINTEGIPCSNIFIWGLSMGGHMALQSISLSRHSRDLAGIIALSCFLSTTSHIWSMDDASKALRIPPIKMIHGEADDLIPCAWGRTTSDMLVEQLGVDVTFSTIPLLRHDLCETEVADIMKWILSKR